MISVEAKRRADPNMKTEPLIVDGEKCLLEGDDRAAFAGIIFAIPSFITLRTTYPGEANLREEKL
jgi:hypothetical protein